MALALPFQTVLARFRKINQTVLYVQETTYHADVLLCKYPLGMFIILNRLQVVILQTPHKGPKDSMFNRIVIAAKKKVVKIKTFPKKN